MYVDMNKVSLVSNVDMNSKLGVHAGMRSHLCGNASQQQKAAWCNIPMGFSDREAVPEVAGAGESRRAGKKKAG